jgi:hypothetical protein
MSKIFRGQALGPHSKKKGGTGMEGREGKGRKGEGMGWDGMGIEGEGSIPQIKFYDYSTGVKFHIQD